MYDRVLRLMVKSNLCVYYYLVMLQREVPSPYHCSMSSLFGVTRPVHLCWEILRYLTLCCCDGSVSLIANDSYSPLGGSLGMLKYYSMQQLIQSKKLVIVDVNVVWMVWWVTGGGSLGYFFRVITACVRRTNASLASDGGNRRMASTALCARNMKWGKSVRWMYSKWCR